LWSPASSSCVAGKDWYGGGMEGGMEELSIEVDVDGSEEATIPEKALFCFSED